MSLTPVHQTLFSHYGEVISSAMENGIEDPFFGNPRLSLENLLWMCKTGEENCANMPEDKASRWLGFVQGCLAMRGLINVDAERSRTRPLFHQVYKNRTGQRPATYERKSG